MNYTLNVFLLCVSMFVVTFMAGYAPSMIDCKKKQLNLVSVYGAGLLVGAALIVVIPEGVKTIFDASIKQHTHEHASESSGDQSEALNLHMESTGESLVDESVTTYIGLATVTGFIVMLIIEEVFKILEDNNDQKQQINEQLYFNNTNDTELIANKHQDQTDEQSEPLLEQQNDSQQPQVVQKQAQQQQLKSVYITTIGLVVHSIADGLALGSSLFLSQVSSDEDKDAQTLGLVIYAAILLHKFPASVGFGTFLAHSGRVGFEVAKHMLCFTLSSPLSALIVYFGLLAFGQGSDEQTLMFWCAIILLFSAGSFLYVATIHILPETYGKEEEAHEVAVSKELGEKAVYSKDDNYSKSVQLLTIVAGTFTPLLLTLMHDDM